MIDNYKHKHTINIQAVMFYTRTYSLCCCVGDNLQKSTKYNTGTYINLVLFGGLKILRTTTFSVQQYIGSNTANLHFLLHNRKWSMEKNMQVFARGKKPSFHLQPHDTVMKNGFTCSLSFQSHHMMLWINLVHSSLESNVQSHRWAAL